MSRGPQVYAGFLRGVNVGGNNKLAMADLRLLFESLGFADVSTFIQSGNVIFTSQEAPDPTVLEVAIFERFDIRTDVVIRNARELKATVSHNPFSLDEQARIHVGFMVKRPAKSILDALDHDAFEPDQFEIIGSDVFIYLPGGVGQSKLPAYLVRQLKTPVTLRNWNSVNKLVELTAR